MYATHTYFSLRSRARSAGATAGCLAGRTESKSSAFDFRFFDQAVLLRLIKK